MFTWLARLREYVGRSIDAQASYVANWLYSRAAFVWLVYGTIAWIPLVILGIDHQGFLYLYIATSLSLVTQVPLAMLAYHASRDAKRGEQLTRQTLQNQSDMMKLMLTKFGGFEEELEEILGDMREHYNDEEA